MLLIASGGRLPRTVRGWTRLCLLLGIPVGPTLDCDVDYSARLTTDERLPGRWLIYYNPRRSERQICRYICHELAEWLAIQDYPSLFDGLPGQVFAYTGGSDPEDARHLIALQVERTCFRGARYAGGV